MALALLNDLARQLGVSRCEHVFDKTVDNFGDGTSQPRLFSPPRETMSQSANAFPSMSLSFENALSNALRHSLRCGEEQRRGLNGTVWTQKKSNTSLLQWRQVDIDSSRGLYATEITRSSPASEDYRLR